MENPYPCVNRDTYEKIGHCVADYGADGIHAEVLTAPTDTASAASPKPAPKSPEGLK